MDRDGTACRERESKILLLLAMTGKWPMFGCDNDWHRVTNIFVLFIISNYITCKSITDEKIIGSRSRSRLQILS